MYKLISSDCVVRIADKLYIPLQTGNRHYAEYLAWLAEGNVPEPADQPSPRDLIIQQITTLEATQTPRRVREAYTDPTWMNQLEAQIAALRSEL